MKSLAQSTLLFGILTILLFISTDAFAVLRNPILDKSKLTKQEIRKQKKQRNKSSHHSSQFDMLSDSITCDTIVLNNGTLITASVFEIGNRRIQYSRCIQINPRKVHILKILVKEIRYQNGKIKTITKPKPLEMAKPVTVKDKLKEIRDAKNTGIAIGLFTSPIGVFLLFLYYRKKSRLLRRTAMRNALITLGISILTWGALILWLIKNFSLDLNFNFSFALFG